MELICKCGVLPHQYMCDVLWGSNRLGTHNMTFTHTGHKPPGWCVAFQTLTNQNNPYSCAVYRLHFVSAAGLWKRLKHCGYYLLVITSGSFGDGVWVVWSEYRLNPAEIIRGGARSAESKPSQIAEPLKIYWINHFQWKVTSWVSGMDCFLPSKKPFRHLEVLQDAV